MVQIQKQDRKTVYRYLLQEGVVAIQKQFSSNPHKALNIPNIQVWMLLRSLKDRGMVQLIFNWQWFYFFVNEEGKKYLADYLNLSEEVVPLTWKKDEKRVFEHYDDQGKVRRIRRDRDNAPTTAPRGGRGGRRPREQGENKEAETTPAAQ